MSVTLPVPFDDAGFVVFKDFCYNPPKKRELMVQFPVRVTVLFGFLQQNSLSQQTDRMVGDKNTPKRCPGALLVSAHDLTISLTRFIETTVPPPPPPNPPRPPKLWSCFGDWRGRISKTLWEILLPHKMMILHKKKHFRLNPFGYAAQMAPTIAHVHALLIAALELTTSLR